MSGLPRRRSRNGCGNGIDSTGHPPGRRFDDRLQAHGEPPPFCVSAPGLKSTPAHGTPLGSGSRTNAPGKRHTLRGCWLLRQKVAPLGMCESTFNGTESPVGRPPSHPSILSPGGFDYCQAPAPCLVQSTGKALGLVEEWRQ